MAKLHEMCGGAMHKQTMSHLKKHTDSHNTGFSCYKEKIHKQTDVRRKERKGRSHSNQRCCGRGFYCPPSTSWDIGGRPVCKAFWELSGTQNESKIGEEINIVHRSFSLQALTHIGSSRLSKSSN